MNKDAIIKFLEALFNPFRINKSLPTELAECIGRSGVEAKFFNVLMARLKYLRENGVNATRYEEFEALSNTKGIYSMHLAGKGFNIRILYSFAPDRSPILLLGFFKRSGKGKTDYTQYISLAQQRLLEELEAYNNEH